MMMMINVSTGGKQCAEILIDLYRFSDKPCITLPAAHQDEEKAKEYLKKKKNIIRGL